MLIGIGNSLNAAIAQSDYSIHQECPIEPAKKTVSKKEKKPSFDYGDRSQLSALILCIMLGFIGAHQIYMKHYFSGILQLSFFLISITLGSMGILLALSWIMMLALWAWVTVDIFLIVFGGLRLKKGKKLIPFEHQLLN